MKIDLRKTRATTAIEDFGDDFLIDENKKSFLSDLEIDLKAVVIFILKLVVCVSGVFGLMYEEKRNLDKLNGQKAILNTEVNSLDVEKKKIEKAIEGFTHIVDTTKEYRNKLEIVQKIADRRLMAMKGLDYIQGTIPEEVWLKKVQLRDKEFTITGVSKTTKQVQDFIEGMESADLFSSVVLQNVSDILSSNQNRGKQFVIVSMLR